MDPTTFDQIAKLFATHRFSRRQALKQVGAAGLVGLGTEAATAQAAPAPDTAALGAAGGTAAPAASASLAAFDVPAANATAIAASTEATKPTTFLFLQSFETGALVPKPGSPGRFTLTLQQGLGDTVYFSDRPQRVVGTVPTAQFLKGLGFPPDNPPNAALIGHRSPTHRDIVVVELFAPQYDTRTHTATYEVALLQDWHKLEETFAQTPDTAQQVPRQYTAAHLFIDDCPDGEIACFDSCTDMGNRVHRIGSLGVQGFCWDWQQLNCLPCGGGWPGKGAQCAATFKTACKNGCVAAAPTTVGMVPCNLALPPTGTGYPVGG